MFAPVATLEVFATDYGLAASVWSRESRGEAWPAVTALAEQRTAGPVERRLTTNRPPLIPLGVYPEKRPLGRRRR